MGKGDGVGGGNDEFFFASYKVRYQRLMLAVNSAVLTVLAQSVWSLLMVQARILQRYFDCIRERQ